MKLIHDYMFHVKELPLYWQYLHDDLMDALEKYYSKEIGYKIYVIVKTIIKRSH
jgi:hypothetical protein